MADRMGCEKCHFGAWRAGVYECHKNAPTGVKTEHGYTDQPVWPLMNGSDWCGDWRYRVEAEHG